MGTAVCTLQMTRKVNTQQMLFLEVYVRHGLLLVVRLHLVATHETSFLIIPMEFGNGHHIYTRKALKCVCMCVRVCMCASVRACVGNKAGKQFHLPCCAFLHCLFIDLIKTSLLPFFYVSAVFSGVEIRPLLN